ncbi:MAG: EndoS/ChiA family endoglycosidase [Mucilaginibacter sp.]
MKPLSTNYIIRLAFLCILLAACKNRNVQSTSNNDLINYKKSKHYLVLGFLVGDGNDPAAAYNPANSPDSVDFLEFFAGRDTTQADWRVAQAKGTRIVVCHFPKDAYFDGSANDPATKVHGYVNPPGFDQNNPTDNSTYNHWAKATYTQDILTDKLDGIDMDLERGTFGGEVPQSNGPNLLKALAVYYGPNCTACTTVTLGGKPVFFYDTDGTVNDNTMYTPLQSNYDYVDFQSYTTGNHAWWGNGTGSFGPLVKTYGLNKLIFLVNGDSFAQAGQPVPPSDAIVTDSLYSYANWVKTHNGVGVGVYRMSRDYNHTPPFAVTRHAIQIMNPAQ